MTFKVEVNDYGIDELNRMAAAHEALRYLPPSRQSEVIEWLRQRLSIERARTLDQALVRKFRLRQRQEWRRRKKQAEEEQVSTSPTNSPGTA